MTNKEREFYKMLGGILKVKRKEYEVHSRNSSGVTFKQHLALCNIKIEALYTYERGDQRISLFKLLDLLDIYCLDSSDFIREIEVGKYMLINKKEVKND